jgi:UDP:flavonoid glycosyltransferase YjiC (YdhE family)
VKFLFCSLSTPGYLNPAIGLALKLRERGHGVAFVTDISCAEELRKNRLTRISYGISEESSFQVEEWFCSLAIGMQLKHIVSGVRQFGPDVLVGQQLTFGPLLMRELTGIPVALLGFCTYLLPDASLDESSLRHQRQVWRHGDMLKWYNEARKALSIPESTSDWSNTPFLGDLFMLRTVTELEGDVSALPARVHLVGSCLWEPDHSDEELSVWLCRAREKTVPIIYVQHGRFFRQPGFWASLCDGLSIMNVCVVASVGRMDGDIGEVPENFLVRQHIPQAQVLRHASAMISSANSTAVLGALTSGVPSVLIPAGGEQPDVAEKCKLAGVAQVLDSATNPSAECLRASLLLVLGDKHMKERAIWIADAFARVDASSQAVPLLEILAQGRGPILRDRKASPESASC